MLRPCFGIQNIYKLTGGPQSGSHQQNDPLKHRDEVRLMFLTL